MPLGTLDRTPPPFFRQGASALSKLMVCSALALFLMVADARFKVTQPLRAAVATALYPVQLVAMGPVRLIRKAGRYFESLQSAQASEAAARQKLALQSQRASQVEQLAQENTRLRNLLALRERITTPAEAAEVLYDAADPYTRKVIIDKGMAQGITAGSPVIDESGVLGQVTRVHPLISEVTLVTDRTMRSRYSTPAPAPAAWRSETPSPAAARSSCASWPATPTSWPATSSPPAASTASTRRGCRWPGL